MNHISLKKGTGLISANTRSHQLRWGDWEMGTAISCTQYIRWLALSRRSVEALQRHRAAIFRLKIVAIIIVTCLSMRACVYGSAGGTKSSIGWFFVCYMYKNAIQTRPVRICLPITWRAPYFVSRLSTPYFMPRLMIKKCCSHTNKF